MRENLERDLPDEDVPSGSQLSRRIRALERAGLLDKWARGKYQLSDLGRDYLAGELDNEELVRLSELDPEEDLDY